MANPAYIQSAISADPSSSGATSIAVAYSTSNLTAGSVLWCYCNWYGTNVAPSCSDGTNGSWVAGPEAYNAGETRGMAMFYFVNTAGGVKPTVTVSWGATSMTFRGLHIFEVGPCATSGQPAGTAPAINYQAAPGAGNNAIVSGNIDTTGNNNALIVGASISDDALLDAGTSPLTWNDRGGWGSGFPSRAEDAVLATGGTTHVAFTAHTGTDNFQTGVMAFKAVGGVSNLSIWQSECIGSDGNLS